MTYGNVNYPPRRNPADNRKYLKIDVLVDSAVIEFNQQRHHSPKPRRKRRVDYAKKIMNDEFLMNL